MTAKGKLFGVSVGPGDPELITLKAKRVLAEANHVMVPKTSGAHQPARDIVLTCVDESKILDLPTPMSHDRTSANAAYDQAADTICALLDQGESVAFATIGDATIYSTYIYVHQRVLARGYDAEIIPGVPSFCAVAAKLNMSLCEGKERLLVCAGQGDKLAESLDFPANKVLMKAGRTIGDLQEELRKRDLLDSASMVANCGLDDELVMERFGDLDGSSSYFSVVVVKDNR